MEIIEGYDVIVDGVDNFPTRYLLNDATVRLDIPVVSASILGFDGQLSVFKPYDGPCYRCLYPMPPPAELAPSCGANGVLGVLPGTMGLLQATEVVKLIIGSGEPLIGRLLLYDALGATLHRAQGPPRPRVPDLLARPERDLRRGDGRLPGLRGVLRRRRLVASLPARGHRQDPTRAAPVRRRREGGRGDGRQRRRGPARPRRAASRHRVPAVLGATASSTATSTSTSTTRTCACSTGSTPPVGRVRHARDPAGDGRRPLTQRILASPTARHMSSPRRCAVLVPPATGALGAGRELPDAQARASCTALHPLEAHRRGCDIVPAARVPVGMGLTGRTSCRSGSGELDGQGGASRVRSRTRRARARAAARRRRGCQRAVAYEVIHTEPAEVMPAARLPGSLVTGAWRRPARALRPASLPRAVYTDATLIARYTFVK